MLSGNYYIRHVTWQVGDASGDLADAASVYGEITFDGKGNYSLVGNVVDAVNQTNTPVGSGGNSAITGTYIVSSSGYTCLSNPLIAGETIFGLVSNSIFIGSSTEELRAAARRTIWRSRHPWPHRSLP